MAAAAPPNHTAVVVDTGTSVKKVCVAFPEDSISGEEALRRADAIEPIDPVFSDQYGSKGLAVCSLCGVGCGDPSNCFCDPARYWAYYRAAPGESSYAYSSRGASTSVVRDGDVEGWKWGKGEPPELTTVGKVCNIDEPPPRTTSSGGTATTTAPPSGGTTTTTGPAPPGGPVTTSSAPPAARPAAAPAAAATPASTAVVETTVVDGLAVAVDGQAAAHARATARAADRESDRGGPSPVALAVFALLLVSLLGWRWRLRRSHRT